MKALIKRIYNSNKTEKIFRYLVIGVITTIISFGSYRALYYNFNLNVHIANALSIILAILFSYAANKHYVFESKCETRRELYKEMFSFYSTRFMAMFVEIGSVFVFYTIFHIHEMISKALAGGIILVLNYIVSHYIVFRQKDS